MKAFVITIMDNEKSVEVAERCIESGRRFGNVIEKYKATTPKDDLVSLYESEGLSMSGHQEKYSRPENCSAAFFSHYSLWKKCVELNETVTIFEHDAVLENAIPKVPFKFVMNIGHPSYGKFNTPSMFGVNRLSSKRYFPGAHAYMVNPEGAKRLINQSKNQALPTDLFMHVDRMPWLQEYYPWVAVAKDSFTTIQKELGTLAKHNKVEIIDAV